MSLPAVDVEKLCVVTVNVYELAIRQSSNFFPEEQKHFFPIRLEYKKTPKQSRPDNA